MAVISVEVGNKLELVAMVKSAEHKEEKVYKSQILDVVDSHHFQISTPIEGFKILLLPVGGRYEATIYSGPSIYVGQVRVTERYKVRNQYVMDIEVVSTLKKFQRRAYFRLEYTRDMGYYLLNLDEMEEERENNGTAENSGIIEEKKMPFENGILLDISGGGCRFTSREKIISGSPVVVKIPLEGDNPTTLTVSGKVLSTRTMDGRSSRFEHRVEFLDIDNATREKIVRFVFEQERKNRKKRKN